MKELVTLTTPCPTEIWDNADASLRIFQDRAIASVPFVRWVGSTGSLDFRRFRISGPDHQQILSLLEDDCTSDIWDIVFSRDSF